MQKQTITTNKTFKCLCLVSNQGSILAFSSKLERSLNFFLYRYKNMYYPVLQLKPHLNLPSSFTAVNVVSWHSIHSILILQAATVQQKKEQTTTPGTLCPVLWDKCVSSLSPVDHKTRTPNHLTETTLRQSTEQIIWQQLIWDTLRKIFIYCKQ